jgi:hypothetical protein
MSIEDSIVESVYQARAKILAEYDGDLWKWIDRLKAAELAHPERIVTADDLRSKCNSAAGTVT